MSDAAALKAAKAALASARTQLAEVLPSAKIEVDWGSYNSTSTKALSYDNTAKAALPRLLEVIKLHCSWDACKKVLAKNLKTIHIKLSLMQKEVSVNGSGSMMISDSFAETSHHGFPEKHELLQSIDQAFNLYPLRLKSIQDEVTSLVRKQVAKAIGDKKWDGDVEIDIDSVTKGLPWRSEAYWDAMAHLTPTSEGIQAVAKGVAEPCKDEATRAYLQRHLDEVVLRYGSTEGGDSCEASYSRGRLVVHQRTWDESDVESSSSDEYSDDYSDDSDDDSDDSYDSDDDSDDSDSDSDSESSSLGQKVTADDVQSAIAESIRDAIDEVSDLDATSSEESSEEEESEESEESSDDHDSGSSDEDGLRKTQSFWHRRFHERHHRHHRSLLARSSHFEPGEEYEMMMQNQRLSVIAGTDSQTAPISRAPTATSQSTVNSSFIGKSSRGAGSVKSSKSGKSGKSKKSSSKSKSSHKRRGRSRADSDTDTDLDSFDGTHGQGKFMYGGPQGSPSKTCAIQ